MKISIPVLLLLMMTMATTVFAEAPPESFEGPVLETIDAGSYTYVRVDAQGGAVWAAAPHFEAKVGQVARFPAAMRMDGYHSKTLDRTFDAVYFVSRVEILGQSTADATPAPVAVPGVALPKGHPAPPRVVDLGVADIARAEGGRTIAELMDQRKDLAGKSVRVRGKVVRSTDEVMGKNWLHLQDGSAGKDGADDLTVTTLDSAKLGDTVLVEGTLALDRSFGHGYDYPVIVEEASCTVE